MDYQIGFTSDLKLLLFRSPRPWSVNSRMSPGPNGGPGTPGSIMQPSPQSMDGSGGPSSQNGPQNDPFSVMQRGPPPPPSGNSASGGGNRPPSSGPPGPGFSLPGASAGSANSSEPMQQSQAPSTPLHSQTSVSSEPTSGPGPGVGF